MQCTAKTKTVQKQQYHKYYYPEDSFLTTHKIINKIYDILSPPFADPCPWWPTHSIDWFQADQQLLKEEDKQAKDKERGHDETDLYQDNENK